MIERPTVFVLGAGASAPFGFPVGRALLNSVCEIPNARVSRVLGPLKSLGFTTAAVEQFCTELRYSGASSVDAFLEHRTEFLGVGKSLIAAVLIPCEQEDRLFEAQQDGVNWYKYLRPRLIGTPDEFSKNKLSIITYNYDRSFEHFLYTALRYTYSLSQEDCTAMCRQIPVLPLHGRLGCLPWQGDGGRDYNPQVSVDSLRRAAESIRVIHEDVEGDPAFEQARQLIAQADLIVFLGFGYNPVNLKRLIPDFTVLKGKTLLGTCFSMRDAEMKEIRKRSPGIELAPSGWDNLSLLRERVILQ